MKEKLILFEHENIDTIIDNIYDDIKVKTVPNTTHKYSVLFMMCKTRESLDIHQFIGQCCVLFWIMILFKQPKLKLSHNSFWIDHCGQKYIEIDASIDIKGERDKNEDVQYIQYCGIPGVMVENIQNVDDNKNQEQNKQDIVLIEPHIFIHQHPSIIEALKK